MAEVVTHPKEAQLAELRRLLAESPVLAVVGIEGIPAPQMQQIRGGLRDRATVRVVKNRLLERALEEVAADREGLAALEDLVEGPTALVASDGNPFRLFKELEATKTKARAKGGEVAPDDILVPAGDTPFKPGPVVGDLQKAGLPAAIERGKVVIRKDTVVVEAGDRIPRPVAQALSRLEILPLIVGLELRGIYEDGQIFTREVLDVDEAGIRRDVEAAAARALALAFELAYPTRATTVPLLQEAHRRALGLALAAEIPTQEVLPQLLARARGEMLSLAARAPEALDEELRAHMGTAEPTAPEPSPPEAEEEAGEAPAEKEEREEGEEEDGGDEEDAAAGLGSLFE